MTIYTKFLTLITILLFSVSAMANADRANLEKVEYRYDQKEGLNLHFSDMAKIKIGTDIECGAIRDGALYASFGLEAQIYRCSKFIINFDGTAQNNDRFDGSWLFKVDFAPLYDSIKTENKPFLLYKKDTLGRDIDGNNHYFDWYKNLGSRVYYLGNTPLVEAYLGYQAEGHKLKLGRLKTEVGFNDDETFFGDDAKFAPMSYWLSKDLFNGGTYSYRFKAVEVIGGLYSGGNPAKGYTRYLDGLDSPNLKTNNTPSRAAKVKLYYDGLVHENVNGYIFGSYLFNAVGSTWADELNDGKRNGSLGALGGMMNIDLDWHYIDSFSLFGQWSYYDSGLKSKSSQNDKSPKFKDIRQKGYFLGTEAKILENKVALGAAFETFDRFDYNIFARHKFIENNPLKGSKQHSIILHGKYNINSIVSLVAAYHKIRNQALFESNILNSRSTDRVKLSLVINM